MNILFNPIRGLHDCLLQAAHAAGLPAESFNPEVHPADPRHGDCQANGAMSCARSLRKNPREVATALLQSLEAAKLLDPAVIEVSIAGPGFINFRYTPAFLLGWLQQYRDEAAFRQSAGEWFRGRTIVVDYSSPNTAKQLHVGHIRSMVIGEAIQRLLRFCGARVIRDNHIGDWGTQFGILILAIRRSGHDFSKPSDNPLQDIERLYREGHRITESDPTALESARQELVRLQQGDPENLAYWRKINEISWQSFKAIYDQLGIQFDQVQGESFYRDQVDRIYRELTETGIACEDQGALVVFHPEHPRFATQPFLIRKKDGASNYASTDLATALHHIEKLQADEIVYVTDGRQQDHFQQLFLTIRKWFQAKGYRTPDLRHAWFGTILGEDGRAIKTRSGEPILLKDLLQEAIQRSLAIVQEKNPEFPPAEQEKIARAVGLGALRYADLSQNRTGDYVFAWDKLLALDGNTAPYLLYAVARLHAIFRKAGLRPGEGEEAATAFETEQEMALARRLVTFPAVLDQVLADLRPHHLCTYLYELSGDFSTFYNANRVLGEAPEVMARRLMLCARTLRTLETGLQLLGLETLERM